MIGIVTHHDHSFHVDTADWGHHSDDGDKAGWHLVEWLKSLDAAETAALHRLLADEGEWPNPVWSADERALWDRYDAAASAALEVGLEGWASRPAFGHNCGLVAI